MIARRIGVALAVALLASAPLRAADWTHEVAPYLWGTALEGTTAVGDATIDVDASFGDILDALEFAAMGTYRGSLDRYSVLFDVVYAALGGDGRGPLGNVKADVDVDQLVLEGDFGYALTERLHGFVGLRYVDLETSVKLTLPGGGRRSARDTADWIDPVIGLHYDWPISAQCSASLRGDIGGCGIGSDFAWQGVGTLRWQVKPGFGADFFEYDMSMQGPLLGAVFTL